VSGFQSHNEHAETPALFQSVSEIRRTCSLNNAPEKVQHRNFFFQTNGRDGALRRPPHGDFSCGRGCI
jgi:hypothetical protein